MRSLSRLVILQNVVLCRLVVFTDKDFGAVEEAFEWTCSAATEHFNEGSRRQNCASVAVYHLLFVCMRSIFSGIYSDYHYYLK